jgi:hypothetical protein
MENLQIHSTNFITYTDDYFMIDVLGGVDLQQVENMICTLRITNEKYPPLRITLDLYSDSHTDRLIRQICDKWGVRMMEVSKSVHTFICRLEKYKLEHLRYPNSFRDKVFEMNEEEKKAARRYLSNKNLIADLQKGFAAHRHIGRRR